MVLPAAFGWPGFLLCLSGLVWCVRARRGAFLIAYLVFFYAGVLGPLHRTFARYGSPLVPALAVTGGLAADWLAARLAARRPRWRVQVALAVALLALPALRLGAFDRLLARADTRDLARDWLVARGAGVVVLTEGAYAHVQAVDASVAAVCRRELPRRSGARRRSFPRRPRRSPSARAPRRLGQRALAAGPVRRRTRAGRRRPGRLGADRVPGQHALPGVGAGPAPRVWRPYARQAPDYRARARGPVAIGAIVGAGPLVLDNDEACWAPVVRFSPGALDAAAWDSERRLPDTVRRIRRDGSPRSGHHD